MSLEESQAWSWEASGWTSRSFFVRFWYALSALLMIGWNLDDEATMRD
jgi:hypothetical protein